MCIHQLPVLSPCLNGNSSLGISVVCPGRALGHQRQLLPYSIWAKVKIDAFELISWQMQLHVFSKTDDPPIVYSKKVLS